MIFIWLCLRKKDTKSGEIHQMSKALITNPAPPYLLLADVIAYVVFYPDLSLAAVESTTPYSKKQSPAFRIDRTLFL